MNRRQVFYLRIAVILLVMLSMLPVSVALNNEIESILENENSEITSETDAASTSNENELMEQEIGLSFNFLISMLQILDLNLNLINGTLNARVEEYPFLQPAIEGTAAGIETTDSVLVVMEQNPEYPDETESALPSLNENAAQLNASLEYPDGMIEAANSTLGVPDSTTPMIEDMFKSLKTMAEVLD